MHPFSFQNGRLFAYCFTSDSTMIYPLRGESVPCFIRKGLGSPFPASNYNRFFFFIQGIVFLYNRFFLFF